MRFQASHYERLSHCSVKELGDMSVSAGREAGLHLSRGDVREATIATYCLRLVNAEMRRREEVSHA